MEGKGALTSILENMDARVRQIEIKGCPDGRVRGERVDNLSHLIEKNSASIGKIFDKIDAINNKFVIGLAILIIIGILAGVNVAGVLHLLPR